MKLYNSAMPAPKPRKVAKPLVGIVMGSAGIMIAVAAHIGGFVIGLVLARPLLLFRYRKA